MKLLWTTIYVTDLDTSIQFYCDIANLKLSKRFNAGPHNELAFLGNGIEGETMIELITDQRVTNITHSESVSIGFAVNSLEELTANMKQKNIDIHSGPFETPNSKFVVYKDPNGFLVQFFESK